VQREEYKIVLNKRNHRKIFGPKGVKIIWKFITLKQKVKIE
jgi:hypothetical protein